MNLSKKVTPTMKYNVGSKVEVLNSRVAKPVGAWCLAEIPTVEDEKGHWFTVKYSSGKVEKMVPICIVRPCPPLMEFVDDMEIGDLAEYCVDNDWIATTLLESLGDDNFKVRQLGGDYKEFTIHRSNLRVPQDWRNEKWGVLQNQFFYQDRTHKQGNAEFLRKIWSRPGAKRTPCLDFSPLKKVQRPNSTPSCDESCIIDADGEDHRSIAGNLRADDDDDDTMSIASSVGSCCPD